MIIYAPIEMVNTGIYGNAIDRWNNITTENLKQWLEFCAFFIAKYERMLIEGQGPINSQEGCGVISNTMGGDDGESVVEDITKYVEIETITESKISEMEIDLSHIKLAVQNPHAVYFATQQQAFQAPPTQIQPPTSPGPYMQHQPLPQQWTG